MKTIAVFSVLLLLAILACIGCSESKSEVKAENLDQPTFENLLQEARLDKAEICVRYGFIIPDSLKDKAAKLTADIVASASSHMSTSDYEDPEDLVEAAGKETHRLYSVSVKHVYLCFVPTGEKDYNPEYVRYEDLTPSQKKVFDYLNR